MLAPRSASAFVCLRCELQLSRQLPALHRRTSYANFSASARRRDGAADLEAQLQASTPVLRIRKEVQPHDRISTRGGKVIREKSKRLNGLKRLGDDAEILVLKEIGDATPEEPEPVLAKERAEPQEVPDILASLQQEKKTLTPEDIHDRLESLRPRSQVDADEQQFVTQATFVNLIKSLTHGFTTQQLSHFYSAAKNIEQDKIHKELLGSLKAETREAKRLIVRSEWQPGTTPIARRLPGIDLARKSKFRPVSKYLLVDRILRDVWKLVPLEEVEAEGEIELLLKPWQLTLLNSGDEPSLAKIGRARKAKLEVQLQQSVLRITADKTTAEYAADDIEEALQSTEVKKVQLQPWIPYLEKEKVPKDGMLATLYTQQDFDMVTSLTRASIQRMDNKNTLVVRALDMDAAAEAERILIRLLPLKDTAAQTIEYELITPHRKPKYLLPTYYDERSLDYKSRNLTLGRWSEHTSQASSTHSSEKNHHEDGEGATSSGIFVKQVVTSLKSIEERGPKAVAKQTLDPKVSYWSQDPEYKLSAEFGLVLGPIKKTGSHDVSEGASPVTTFLPSFPGLASLLTSNHFQADGGIETPALLYKFVAAPEQNNLASGESLPNLHIQMRTGRKGSPATLDELSIEFQELTHDVLLPSKAADIRFHHTGRLTLRKNHNDKNVKKWIEVVCANIASGARLTAPSLTIDIPKWTLPNFPAKARGMLSVIYLFSAVQFRQSIVGRVENTPASYSTVQSDKLGPRGGSFSMHHTAYEGQDDSTQSEKESPEGLQGFVKNCFQMVDRITEAAGQTLPVSKTLKPRTEESARRQKRLGEQVAQAMGSDRLPSTDAIKEGEDLANDIESLLRLGRAGSKDSATEEDIFDSVLDKNGPATKVDCYMHSAIGHSSAEVTADPHMSNALALHELEEVLTKLPAGEGKYRSEDTLDEDTSRLLHNKD